MSAKSVLWETWDAFWQDTSIAGVNNAGKARKSLVRRYIWLLLFVLGMVATYFSLKIVIDEYVMYPVTTTITILHKDKVGREKLESASMIQLLHL